MSAVSDKERMEQLNKNGLSFVQTETKQNEKGPWL